MSRPRIAFTLAGLLVASVALALWVMGGRLLASDTDSMILRADLSDEGMKEIRFRADDGVALRGWWMPGKDPARAVLLLHGFGADGRSMLARAKWIHEAGYSTFLLDLRGCGKSAGGRAAYGYAERLDVEGALRFLTGEEKVLHVVLLGRSMGGAAALMAVDRWRSVRGMVLESVYARFEEAVRARLMSRLGCVEPLLSGLLLGEVRLRYGFDPAELAPVDAIRRIPCPSLIVAGAKDPVGGAAEAGLMFSVAPSPSTLWILQEAGHVDFYRFETDEYKKRVGEFLRTTLGAPGEG